MLAETRRRGSEVRYCTELVSFTQDDTGVVAMIKDLDSDALSAVHADYLLAADGTHSPIRRQLAISTSGFGELPIFVVFIYFRAPWRQFVADLGDGDAVQINNPEVTGIFVVAQGDLGVFMITYFPSHGETIDQFTRERCRETLLKAVGAEIDVEIVDVAPWQPYEQVADQFRCGRVFLVGDSAHTMPPLKGGGANTAIQSAHNLAWKLAAILNGTAGPGLLDTYHFERHPVGRFAARQSLTGPGASFLPLGDNRPTLPAEEERPLFYMVAGYKYRSAAVVTDEPAPPTPMPCSSSTPRNCAGNPEPGCRTHGCNATVRASPRSICSERASRYSPVQPEPHGWPRPTRCPRPFVSRSRSTSSDPMQASETSTVGGHNSPGSRPMRRCWYVPMISSLGEPRPSPNHRVQTSHQALCRILGRD